LTKDFQNRGGKYYVEDIDKSANTVKIEEASQDCPMLSEERVCEPPFQDLGPDESDGAVKGKFGLKGKGKPGKNYSRGLHMKGSLVGEEAQISTVFLG